MCTSLMFLIWPKIDYTINALTMFTSFLHTVFKLPTSKYQYQGISKLCFPCLGKSWKLFNECTLS